MDVLTSLSEKADLSKTKLQLIILAWTLSGIFERKNKVSMETGHVDEADYNKQSIYSMLYAIYRTVGTVKSETGEPYEFTFNTWGYAWPSKRTGKLTTDTEPQRFGKNAYTGLYDFKELREFIKQKKGKVHVVELGSGTGAGANHVCKSVLPECTYQAVDMQRAAYETCKRKHTAGLNDRLEAVWADATQVGIAANSADIVAVCETHVTEINGVVGEEDKLFFQSMHRILKKGGYLTWGNVIPDNTWQPCFDYLKAIGMKMVEARDVTKDAILARRQDQPRVRAYVTAVTGKFFAFKIPVLGTKRKRDAELAIKNFYRDPGTSLFNDMVKGIDTYKVVLFKKIK